ncbi:MAG: hypothetical protein ABIP82_04630 [Nitrospirales bacterium]
MWAVCFHGFLPSLPSHYLGRVENTRLEVAQRFDMAMTTIYKIGLQRRILYVKIGGALKFNLAQVERGVQEQTVMRMTRR